MPKGTTGAFASSPALRPGSTTGGVCTREAPGLLSWLPLHLQTRYIPNKSHLVVGSTGDPPRLGCYRLPLPGL